MPLKWSEANSCMTDLAAKEQILKENGYSYSFDRELYVNRSSKLPVVTLSDWKRKAPSSHLE